VVVEAVEVMVEAAGLGGSAPPRVPPLHL